MKNQRILPYAMSQKLDEKDLQDISASGTTQATAEGTHMSGSGYDVNADVKIDF